MPIDVGADRIADRAHAIWQREGCPDGRDRDHWIRAWWELIGEEARRRYGPDSDRT